MGYGRNYSSWLSFRSADPVKKFIERTIPDEDQEFPVTDSCDCGFRNCNCKDLTQGSGSFESNFSNESREDYEALHGSNDRLEGNQFDSNDDLPEEAGK